MKKIICLTAGIILLAVGARLCVAAGGADYGRGPETDPVASVIGTNALAVAQDAHTHGTNAEAVAADAHVHGTNGEAVAADAHVHGTNGQALATAANVNATNGQTRVAAFESMVTNRTQIIGTNGVPCTNYYNAAGVLINSVP